MRAGCTELKSSRPGLRRTWAMGAAALSLMLGLILAAPTAQAEVRIKDIANFEGVRENHLIGYGLVVGLLGTGDKLNSSPFTRESIRGMLETAGRGQSRRCRAQDQEHRRGHGHRETAALRAPRLSD